MNRSMNEQQRRKCADCIHTHICEQISQYISSHDSGIVERNADECKSYEERMVNLPQCSYGDGVTIRLDGIHELSPHNYTLTEKLRNVTIEILKCEDCGDVSIGWYRQENTEDITDDEQ